MLCDAGALFYCFIREGNRQVFHHYFFSVAGYEIKQEVDAVRNAINNKKWEEGYQVQEAVKDIIHGRNYITKILPLQYGILQNAIAIRIICIKMQSPAFCSKFRAFYDKVGYGNHVSHLA